MKNELTLASLFDGSGGFPLGGILAGITPLWASEIEPFAVRITTKRLPQMKHYGDVSSLNGAELPPVNIITFGSPCQDMSIAGKRSGLDGSRSSLFYEAVRIIKEMRCATDGRYPRFAVWENVPGAFSSNKGEDFRAVLESLCRIKDETVSVPRSEKWTNAGEILADGFSLAWRVLDAQYWGVPQRRKRIYLVADFDSECAGKILFESEGLSGYSAEGFKAWQRTAAATESGSGTTGAVCLNDQGGNRMDVTEEVTCTLRAEAHHPPCVMESAAGFCTEHSAKARGIGYEDETSPTLRAGTVPAAVYENHSQDTRYTELHGIAPTVSSTYGTGGNNQPFVVEDTRCFDVRFTSDGTKNARHNCYETDTSRTIDTGGNSPDSNQGGVAVVAVQGSMIGRADKNGPQGSGINEDVSFTLNATDRHAVAFSQDSYTKYSENDKCGALRATGGMYGGGSETLVYSTSKNSYHTEAEENLANTLVASDYKDPPTVNSPEYIVRRLTPTECARLQGFPDWWCADLGTDEPTDEELRFWKEVFETHRKIIGSAVKPKSEKQIRTWLKNPHSDSAEYKLWGNGVVLPCVYFVLSGIVYCTQLTPENIV
jgi:DNA (cytosine-5)-methyltransferase 1|nr:MAG TPA: Cytosine specific methyltransferase [Caudoviricetes sp.]DAY38094.1 MAG TPA: Cytosine specific methyltransferase [Caudoviricetes sp.]DAZ06062.1 MAG TPA: Cytosine specific methyltransferase [Caudoviricetes sp.]